MAGVKVQGFRIWKTGKRELALNIGQMFGREIQAKMGRVFFLGGVVGTSVTRFGDILLPRQNLKAFDHCWMVC